jgi:hypothetical protein
MKRIEALNKLERKYDKDKIKDIIISPIKITNDKKNEQLQNNKYLKLENEYNPTKKIHLKQLHTHWRNRTNQPYKNIMKDTKYYQQFLEKDKLHNINKSELIVHKVTNEDKKGVLEDFHKIQNNIKKHDSDLKVIYSLSKQAEHIKKFEYVHVNKFRFKYDPSDHKKLKGDKIALYKKEQQKMEDEKFKKDMILDKLMEQGAFTQQEEHNIDTQNSKKKFKFKKNFAQSSSKKHIIKPKIKPPVKSEKIIKPIIKPNIKHNKNTIVNKGPRVKSNSIRSFSEIPIKRAVSKSKTMENTNATSNTIKPKFINKKTKQYKIN